METILVTGGAGYIGSHACKALAAAGYRPVVLDNLVYGHASAVRWGPLEVGDLADPARLREVFSRYRPAAVMHFAAYAYVGESVENPAKYYENNVAGTLNLLAAMRESGSEQLVFSSTCASYGHPQTDRIAESHPQVPINPYGRSKLMMEQILADYSQAYGLRSISLRYFNAAGADADGEVGEDHDPETHLIPIILEAAAGRRPSVQVFGTDYDTPDGTCIRDYIHVADLAAAHVTALAALMKGHPTDVFNLGTGRGASVREVIDRASVVTGREIPVVTGPRRPGDPAKLVADAARAGEILGWVPHWSDLDTILASAWRWHQAHWSVSEQGSENDQASPVRP